MSRLWTSRHLSVAQNVLESATRSWLRMRNLVAVRGIPGASMIGPADYFGNLEMPHRYRYTIAFQSWNPIPEFRRLPIKVESIADSKHSSLPLPSVGPVVVRARWKSHLASSAKVGEFGPSLFPLPGVMLVDEKEIRLPYFEAENLELPTRFRARLVRNDVPLLLQAASRGG